MQSLLDLFNHFPLDQHLCCSLFSAIVTSVAAAPLVHESLHIRARALRNKFPEEVVPDLGMPRLPCPIALQTLMS